MGLQISNTSLAITVFVSIFIFTCIYAYIKDNWSESFYDAVMTQTLIGGTTQPKTEAMKLALSVQALFAYFITAGAIVFFIRKHSK